MRKGILLELEGRKGIILTPQGEFKRIPVPQGNWEIGDEISFLEQAPKPWLRWGLYAAAAILLVVLAPVGYQGWALSQPVALVTIDINPSVQLTVNSRIQVIKAEALNEDGTLVLQGVDWNRHPVDQVVAAVTARAVEAGKLQPEDASQAVVVAVAPAKEKELSDRRSEEILTKARTAAEVVVAEKAEEQQVEQQAHVVGLRATKRDRDEAKEKGLTPGQGMIFDEILATRPEALPEQMRQKGPGKLIKELGVNPGEIFSKAEERHGGKPALPAAGKPAAQTKDATPGKGNSGNGQSKARDEKTGKDREKEKDQAPGRGNGRDQEKGQEKDVGQGRDPAQDRGKEGNRGNRGNQGKQGKQGNDRDGPPQDEKSEKPVGRGQEKGRGNGKS